MVVVSSDAYGNTTRISETVEIDTVPHPIGVNANGVGGDGTVNAAEMAGGLAVTGTSAPGATVEVSIQGVTHSVVTGAGGA